MTLLKIDIKNTKKKGRETMALTEKQLKFVEYLAMGMSQKDAYCRAYDTKTKNQNTLAVNACKVANNPEVKAYLELVKESKQNVLAVMATKDQANIRTLINQRIEHCIKNNDENNVVKYIDMLSKLNGDYININRNVSDESKALQNLSTDELKRLLDEKKG